MPKSFKRLRPGLRHTLQSVLGRNNFDFKAYVVIIKTQCNTVTTCINSDEPSHDVEHFY